MARLVAEQLRADPRVDEARRLLHEALTDAQWQFTGPRPGDPQRKQSYEAALQQFRAWRGSALYYPYLGSGVGRGALVELADGSVKFDMISGIGVHGFGHSHPALLDAAFDAALSDVVMQGNLQQNEVSAQLTGRLIDAACDGGAALAHCFLTTSGAMANENALKMVFQKHHPADRILAFERCFMGRSLATAAITDKPAYREGVPRVLAVDYVPFFDADDPAGSTERAVRVLRSHLEQHPGQHAAMCFELIQGEGGYYPGDRDFFLALIGVLREHGVAVFVDEVQTFGRTSRLFAFQHYGLDAHVDVVTIGKLSQVCATLFTEAYTPQRGLISQTFTGATASLHAATAILTCLTGGGFFGQDGRIARVYQHFTDRFAAIAARHPEMMRGPFGMGGMIAFQAFDGNAETTRIALHRLFDAGLIAFVAGGSPARIRMLPPIAAITDDDVSAVCDIIERVLTELAASQLPP